MHPGGPRGDRSHSRKGRTRMGHPRPVSAGPRAPPVRLGPGPGAHCIARCIWHLASGRRDPPTVAAGSLERGAGLEGMQTGLGQKVRRLERTRGRAKRRKGPVGPPPQALSLIIYLLLRSAVGPSLPNPGAFPLFFGVGGEIRTLPRLQGNQAGLPEAGGAGHMLNPAKRTFPGG